MIQIALGLEEEAMAVGVRGLNSRYLGTAPALEHFTELSTTMAITLLSMLTLLAHLFLTY
jgi:hypothetical protein